MRAIGFKCKPGATPGDAASQPPWLGPHTAGRRRQKKFTKQLTVTLSYVISLIVKSEFSVEELARAVQDWCAQHQVFPANGQAAEEITERNIRYYRTLGLLDPPLGNYAKTFSEKHRLQLIAIRLYQAQGLPLRKIRDELYGKSLEDLVALEKQVGKQGKRAVALPAPFAPPVAGESWAMVPLTPEFLLVSRQNRQLPRGVIDKIRDLLRTVRSENATAAESNKN